ncbi:MAG: tRNA (guanosine(37)-N1)-methyltransferase TrmD [Bacteroidales bacterium]|nr:tRNA (guanosine(37)-N1)-methyltransferase TrmD [Bacteroidales bacterium]
MRIDILTVMPELLDSPFGHSILKRAAMKGVAEICVHNLRDFSDDKHRRTDDYAFGGRAGMVMTVQPIDAAIAHLKAQRTYDEIIYTSPDGELFAQKAANRLSLLNNIIILCGHYKGVDQRVREHLITKEYSIGDYVLTGGELPAAVMVDCIVRLLPGAMSDETSALTDSFQDGLLSPPVYTRPAEYNGWKVPDILMGGNERQINEWNENAAYERTALLRPDLLEEQTLKNTSQSS